MFAVDSILELGWLSDAQMVCAPAGTSIVELTPLESDGGTKAALIPRSATLAVVVESRRAIGQTITHEGASVTLLSRTDGSDEVQVIRP